MNKKRILILSNHFITLYNFRKELIQKLIDEGHQIYISLPKAVENNYFTSLGCKIIDTPVDRRGINPINDIKLILKYIKIINKIKPDIIFSYTIKPNIYGSIASNLLKYKQINNITGTGGTFFDKNLISHIASFLYKISIKKSYKVFFQNAGDQEYFRRNRLVRDNTKLIPGSGVNLKQFGICDFPDDEYINFIYIGRVMEIKGINEYLETAKYIKNSYHKVNFYVAGFIEDKFYEKVLKDYESQGVITYLGFQKDITTWIQKCHCTILPSHGGEGIPNVLLETAAMGRVCIASDINGSRDVIEEGVTGYLFNAKKSSDLIKKVSTFLETDYENKREMGLAGRRKVENEFDRNIVIDNYIKELEKV